MITSHLTPSSIPYELPPSLKWDIRHFLLPPVIRSAWIGHDGECRKHRNETKTYLLEQQIADENIADSSWKFEWLSWPHLSFSKCIWVKTNGRTDRNESGRLNKKKTKLRTCRLESWVNFIAKIIIDKFI